MSKKPLPLRLFVFWHMTLVALVTVGFLGVLSHLSLVRTIDSMAKSEQRRFATQTAAAVGYRLGETDRLVRTLATEAATGAFDEARLGFYLQHFPQLSRLSIVDSAGHALLSVSRQADWPTLTENAPSLRVSAMIGEGLWRGGYVIGSLEPLVLSQFVSDARSPRRTRLILSDSRGNKLMEAGARRNEIADVGAVRVREALAGRQPLPHTSTDEGRLTTVVRLADNRGYLAVEESAAEALAAVRMARVSFFLLTPLAFLIAVVLAYHLADFVASPLRRRMERLAVAVMEAQENERRRIAQDIHDWTAQRITSSFYQVQLIQRLLGKKPEAVPEELASLAENLDSANTEVREIMRNLHPHLLNELGLASAVRELVGDFARKNALDHSLEVEEAVADPPKFVGTALFRILQEGLNNVQKHAQASRVDVGLTIGKGRATLMLRDDGRGFDASAPPQGRMGLAGMRERAELLGGTLEIESAPGRGTKIEVTIPWR